MAFVMDGELFAGVNVILRISSSEPNRRLTIKSAGHALHLMCGDAGYVRLVDLEPHRLAMLPTHPYSITLAKHTGSNADLQLNAIILLLLPPPHVAIGLAWLFWSRSPLRLQLPKWRASHSFCRFCLVR
jgi:hypothetical protein